MLKGQMIPKHSISCNVAVIFGGLVEASLLAQYTNNLSKAIYTKQNKKTALLSAYQLAFCLCYKTTQDIYYSKLQIVYLFSFCTIKVGMNSLLYTLKNDMIDDLSLLTLIHSWTHNYIYIISDEWINNIIVEFINGRTSSLCNEYSKSTTHNGKEIDKISNRHIKFDVCICNCGSVSFGALPRCNYHCRPLDRISIIHLLFLVSDIWNFKALSLYHLHLRQKPKTMPLSNRMLMTYSKAISNYGTIPEPCSGQRPFEIFKKKFAFLLDIQIILHYKKDLNEEMLLEEKLQ
ncbi:hypothetical protein RFI_16173 [Reticulomyxa filosa]|uniref:Uncharacterized protein n=1 Tax=Reticulomyxa filosa TaxID=46433 RepID=X6N5L4_RETFI|nr:hypothetical protein RFI_16173 [Reticulomyxa filosa]|eukprot:ETO21034.1 hypothetical protein RFI_16173 [Reticulomyxa filosa]